jgi:ATP-dependent DNA helicase RecQ
VSGISSVGSQIASKRKGEGEQMRRKKLTDVERYAREQFGFSSLRPGQHEAVKSVLDQRDTVVIQPTGSGKSAIYQVAGLLMDGPTIVVSPLIALQKDQVTSITAQPHSAKAAFINSSLTPSNIRGSLETLCAGELEFLFLSPEQLGKQEIREALKAALRRCSSSMRPTALANGGMTFDLNT